MKIEFEDQGQDLLRWEFDPETGLITDCQPYHAEIYTDGAHFVELESVKIGFAPFYYASAADAENKMGRYLRYPVMKITQANEVAL